MTVKLEGTNGLTKKHTQLISLTGNILRVMKVENFGICVQTTSTIAKNEDLFYASLLCVYN